MQPYFEGTVKKFKVFMLERIIENPILSLESLSGLPGYEEYKDGAQKVEKGNVNESFAARINEGRLVRPILVDDVEYIIGSLELDAASDKISGLALDDLYPRIMIGQNTIHLSIDLAASNQVIVKEFLSVVEQYRNELNCPELQKNQRK